MEGPFNLIISATNQNSQIVSIVQAYVTFSLIVLRLGFLLSGLFVDGLSLALMLGAHSGQHEQVVAQSIDIPVHSVVNVALGAQWDEISFGSPAHSPCNVQLRSCESTAWQDEVFEGRQLTVELINPGLERFRVFSIEGRMLQLLFVCLLVCSSRSGHMRAYIHKACLDLF